LDRNSAAGESVMWRERLLTILMVPVLVLPLLVIAAGGDLDILWHEASTFTTSPIVLTVYAQIASPTVGPSPTATILMTPTTTRSPVGGRPHEAPLLTRWGYISGSIILALIAAWSLAGRAARLGRRR
jgi:hypothetical protein